MDTQLLLTPNRRMAQFMGKALPLDDWLSNQWQELKILYPSETPYCLNSFEQLILWEEIILQSSMGESLLRSSSTAQFAMSAWNLEIEWRINKNGDENFVTEDRRVYLHWAKLYQKRCLENQWIDLSGRVEILIEAFKQKKLLLPKKIQLVGFDELTPQQQELFKIIQEVGTEVHTISLVSKKANVYTLGADDPETELLLAANQAKAWMASKPNARVGIVIPDLEHRRQTVFRVFQEIFSEIEFNIAAPVPLSSYPFIKSALLALELAKQEVTLPKLSFWLRSPFFSRSLQERAAKAAVDVYLREWGESVFSWSRVLFYLEPYPELINLNNLKTFFTRITHLQGKKSTNAWCLIFQDLLKCLGWLEDRSLTSVEHQLKMQWEQLLLNYQQLERVLGEHTYSEALFRLTSLANNISFLPYSPNANLQVLGVLEATGIPFDYLWVLGLHRENWPMQPLPNPFIPFSIQRQCNLPRNSAQRELQVAKRLTERLCQGATIVILSYPTLVEDQVCTESSLLSEFPKITVKDLELSSVSSFLSKISRVQKKIVLEETGPKILEGEKIQGGSRIVKLQSLCPFRAFSEIRLQLKPIPKTWIGLTSGERGEILHQILMYFWEGLNHQGNLLSLTEDQLFVRINTIIDQVIQHWQKKRPKTLTPKYVVLEKKRLFKLILKFIELEKSRDWFEVVEKEQEYVLTEGHLQFKICIDRVDKLSNGEEVLIDYKTGHTSLSDWFGERPRDPQLLLYCILRDPKPFGVVFAKLNSEEVKFQGLAKASHQIPGVKTVQEVKNGGEADWDAQCDQWKKTLKALFHAFKEGIADVDPLQGKNTCRTCTLQSVCRIHCLDPKVLT